MWYLIVSIPDLCTLLTLLKDHNAVTPVRLEPAAPGLESSTLPLHSLSDAREGLGAPGNQGDKKYFSNMVMWHIRLTGIMSRTEYK